MSILSLVLILVAYLLCGFVFVIVGERRICKLDSSGTRLFFTVTWPLVALLLLIGAIGEHSGEWLDTFLDKVDRAFDAVHHWLDGDKEL